jgi:ferredoxin
MPTVKFINDKKTIEVPEGANLRAEALKQGIQTNPGIFRWANCLGNGACTTCRVRVTKGAENLSKVGWKEWIFRRIHPLFWWVRIGEESNTRLACQARVYGDCEVETRPPLNLHGEEKFWS